MANKKKAKKKVKRAAPKKAATSLVTGFLSDFRLFLTKANRTQGKSRLWIWPPAGQSSADSLTTISAVISMLGKAFVSSKPPGPDTSSPFIGRVAERVSAYPWPTSPDYQGEKPFGFAASTVNLYEIGQVADLMLQALNAGGEGGTGGGGTRWPPVK
jgi:hypothetical protein